MVLREDKRLFTVVYLSVVNIFRVFYQIVNVGDLQKFIDSRKIDPSKIVNKMSLYEAGIIKKLSLPVKILGNGVLKTTLKVELDAASVEAIRMIENTGGEIVLHKTKKQKRRLS